MGDYYDRYKKNLLFAFPFELQNHHFCTELANGIVDERKDRLLMNPHDFVVAHQWVSVENGERGIGLFSREMPLFHLGDIHYNKISSKIDYSISPSIFLYAASNEEIREDAMKRVECEGNMVSLSAYPFAYVNLLIRPQEQLAIRPEAIRQGVKTSLRFLWRTAIRLCALENAAGKAMGTVFVRVQKKWQGVPNEPYNIQKHVLPELSYQALTVVPVFNDKECTKWKND